MRAVRQLMKERGETTVRSLLTSDPFRLLDVPGFNEPEAVLDCLKQLPDVFRFSSSGVPSSLTSSAPWGHEKVAFLPSGLTWLLNTDRARQLKKEYLARLWAELRACKQQHLLLSKANNPLIIGDMWPSRLVRSVVTGSVAASSYGHKWLSLMSGCLSGSTSCCRSILPGLCSVQQWSA